MYTLLLSISSGILLGFLSFKLITPSYALSVIIALVTVIATNIIVGRTMMKKITAIFNNCEKDIKSGKIDIAIEKMKTAYSYANWQLMVRSQIDAQIGVLLYATKRFDESLPYLLKSSKRNSMAISMLLASYYKAKDFDKMKNLIDVAVKVNKKDSFMQALSAYLYLEIGDRDKAISILNDALKKIPTDERLHNALDSTRNNKKIKMQTYGTLWLQLHLSKSPDGVKQYQTLIGRQKITRR